ncbi:trinucleotide repeat-containing gene 6C protein [Pelodytes ibericus]
MTWACSAREASIARHPLVPDLDTGVTMSLTRIRVSALRGKLEGDSNRQSASPERNRPPHQLQRHWIPYVYCTEVNNKLRRDSGRPVLALPPCLPASLDPSGYLRAPLLTLVLKDWREPVVKTEPPPNRIQQTRARRKGDQNYETITPLSPELVCLAPKDFKHLSSHELSHIFGFCCGRGLLEKEKETQKEDHLMEEKKKKKQEEKKKKEGAQKKAQGICKMIGIKSGILEGHPFSESFPAINTAAEQKTKELTSVQTKVAGIDALTTMIQETQSEMTVQVATLAQQVYNVTRQVSIRDARLRRTMPEPIKTNLNQPQPVTPSTSTSTVSNNNGKRSSANGLQPAASRYLPREVPPRFRQQEQKQLLKRGQPLPTGALSTANPSQDTGQTRASSPLQGAGRSHLSSKTHSELCHSCLGDHYENSHWGPQATLRSETNCSWDKVIIDRSDKEAWPSITGTETESATECTISTDSASNCGSENSSMATSAQGNFTGHAKKTNGNNGTNGALIQSTSNPSALGAGGTNGNGNLARVWGVAPVNNPGIVHCSSSSGDGKMEGLIGDGRSQNCWGASNSNPGINLNPNANPAAWPVLGHDGTMSGCNPSSICSPASAMGQNISNQNGNTAGALGAWRNLQSQESTESQTSTSQNVSFSIQPQNLNTDGPNNTSNMNSSPNPINAMQANGLPNWGMAVGMGSIIPTHLQSLPGANGNGSVSQGVGDSTGNSVWGLTPGMSASGNCSVGFSQGMGDTVTSNSSAKQNGSSCVVQKEGNAWDSGPPASPGVLAWGRGRESVGSTHSGPWGHPGRGSNNNVNGEWCRVPNQHSFNEVNVKGSGWDSPSVTMPNPVTQQGDLLNSRAKALASCTTASEVNSDGQIKQNEGRVDGDKVNAEQGQIQLPRQDLDPRVLSNTGWGQVPVKQNIAWELEEFQRPDKKNIGTEAWGSSNPQPSNSGGKSEGSIVNSTNTSSVSGWVSSQPISAPINASWVDNKMPNGPGGWGDPASSTVVNAAAKSGHAWSGSTNQEDRSPTWSEPHKAKPQSWTDGQKSNSSWNNAGGDWTDASLVPTHVNDVKKNGTGWDTDSKSGPGWNENARPGTSGWGNGTSTKVNPGTGWGESLKAPQQNWSNKAQDSNATGWGGSTSVKQTGSGWVGGPVPAQLPAKQKESSTDPNGWEEPSPPSIRRKMEIDDGTSAWGDPSNYNSKTVNLWDKNNPVVQTIPSTNTNSNTTPTTTPNISLVEPQTPHQPNVQQNRSPLLGPGWGDMPPVHSKTEASWGETLSPSTAVDNGTSAWGKPTNSSSGWGDGSAESPGTYGRTSAPAAAPVLCKPAAKSMQEGWGNSGDEVSLASQWEDDEGDLWNNAASQDGNPSCNSWGNGPKKILSKGIKTSSKSDEAWIVGRLTKQLTDMGFPKEPAEEALKSNNMNLDQAMSALLEKKVEMDKRALGMADYNTMVSKPLSCRPPQISKESSMDRPTFLDKDGGLVEEPTSSPFLPSPSLKLPHSNGALPNQALGGMTPGLSMQNLNSSRQIQSGNLGMFGNSGAAQARSMQQQPPPPPVQPLNSSQPSLRAQVPQFLSPQVQAQLLQFAAKNIGLNPALLTSPINPQHMTMLNQLYQLQLAYQRLQLQQQMLQAQRNVSGPMRQQEQQVARTINNMQQQIQQHQRQLAQALLMKQQPPTHPSLHPPAGKSALDSFPSHATAPSLSDLHTKEQQSSTNTYAPYPLAAGLSSMNVNSLDMTGSLTVKDTSQSQSRLPQWTHPNSMDSLTNAASSLDPSPNKSTGALPGHLSIGPPGKPSLDDSYNRYDLLPSSESPNSPPVAVPDSWSRAKPENEKISNGSSITWPPEFHPGVPWKGLQNIDPENDPDVTPGSVPTGPTINTTIQDVNRYLLKSGGKLTDMKSTWSSSPISHTQAALSHELWKVPRNTTAPTRPPPGLTNAKPSPAWGANQLGWTSSYSSGSTWSTDSSGRTSSWLVLRNLTPQIDGSTLRTLCLQHGPLITFHLNLTQGNAVVRYSSKEEATKAQKSLHMCVLGNTTILAEFAGEDEVNRFLAQGQSLPPTSSWQSNSGNSQPRLGTGGGTHNMVRNDTAHWNPTCLSAKGSNDLLWGGVPQYSSSLWGPPGTDDSRIIRSPTPLTTLLPGDLLSGESM